MAIRRGILAGALVAAAALTSAAAQTDRIEAKLHDVADVFAYFTAEDENSIPTALLQRAHGIAVIPNVFRGGFFLGARRGKGVLVVRTESGHWSNPAFITLTGGSIGWQFGAESADVVLIFANDRSVQNIANGKFTLGGDASGVAGPVGTHNTAAVTFKSEIYAYYRSRGLFAGASLEGARLALDDKSNTAFYGRGSENQALGAQSIATPSVARRFLLSVEQATAGGAEEPVPVPPQDGGQAVTFPLDDSE